MLHIFHSVTKSAFAVSRQAAAGSCFLVVTVGCSCNCFKSNRSQSVYLGIQVVQNIAGIVLLQDVSKSVQIVYAFASALLPQLSSFSVLHSRSCAKHRGTTVCFDFK